ncbi:MAG: chloride channel protein [Scytolyngbya sp. HA4215-MV1]|jgi:H+/Cl- antiporter ClcA|nr:chloride channel protein [Scytolyngbya sp. HA4215-MV1]
MAPKKHRFDQHNWAVCWLSHLSARNPFTLSRWVVCWAVIGIGSGLFAGLYWNVLELLTHFLRSFQGISLLIVMSLSGLLIGLIIHVLGNPGEISLIVDNIHSRGGRIDTRENPSMVLASLVSISSGGSLGPEAPMVQVTGSFGTWVADFLELQGEDVRSLSVAGMAAGFTALFGAPLGGAFFALEILHHQYVAEYYQAVLPAIVSSCASYLVFAFITHLGISPTWTFPQYHVNNIDDFPLAIASGVVGAIAAWVFIGLVKSGAWLFAKLPEPVYIRTTMAGLGLGILATFVPLTRYFGHEELNRVVESREGALFLLILAFAKMSAIAITVNGEWRGGFIIPLFFTGACIGKAIALLVPGLHPVLTMIAVMAALNAAVTRTPISTTLLLTKLTGFSPLTPILFASLVGFFLAPKLPFIKSQIKSQTD